jgi:hypothetical protein
MKLVEVRGFDHGVSVCRDFSVTLVIGDDENDVGLRSGLGEGWDEGKKREQQA